MRATSQTVALGPSDWSAMLYEKRRSELQSIWVAKIWLLRRPPILRPSEVCDKIWLCRCWSSTSNWLTEWLPHLLTDQHYGTGCSAIGLFKKSPLFVKPEASSPLLLKSVTAPLTQLIGCSSYRHAPFLEDNLKLSSQSHLVFLRDTFPWNFLTKILF